MAVQGSAHAYILGVRGGGVAHVSTCMDVKAISTLSTPEYLYKKEEGVCLPVVSCHQDEGFVAVACLVYRSDDSPNLVVHFQQP